MRSTLPTRSDAWRFLNDQGAPDWVPRHCLCVECLAVAMAQRATACGLEVDADLVARGALLHDIGRSVTQDLRHAYLGADIVRQAGLPESMARVIETHTGAGVAADEAAAAGLPDRDYIPAGLEEKIVAHADNLYAGDKRVDLAWLEAKYEGRGLVPAWKRIEALHQELCDLLDADLEALAPADLAEPV